VRTTGLSLGGEIGNWCGIMGKWGGRKDNCRMGKMNLCELDCFFCFL
jgi:hypothetical protein